MSGEIYGSYNLEAVTAPEPVAYELGNLSIAATPNIQGEWPTGTLDTPLGLGRRGVGFAPDDYEIGDFSLTAHPQIQGSDWTGRQESPITADRTAPWNEPSK